MAHQTSGIFGKRRLTPGQLRQVAEHRFNDAMCLFDSGETARATGAMYVGGFVIECLLKALLLERHPNLQQPVHLERLSRSDRGVNQLLFSHDLDAMLEVLPEVEKKLRTLMNQRGQPLWEPLRTVCEQWTVYARYSPKLAKRPEAERFLETIREVKRWLREL